MSTSDEHSTVDATLRLAGGVEPAERPAIVEHWASLDQRLRSFRSEKVDLQLTVKERGTSSQHTTLEAWIGGWPRLVATSKRPDFDAAIQEVRDDMIRLVSTTKQKTEPRNNRHLRETGRS